MARRDPIHAVEVPPGDAVDGGHHRRVGTDERRHIVQRVSDQVRLQRNEQHVLRPEFRRLLCDPHCLDGIFFDTVLTDDADSAGADGSQRLATGNTRCGDTGLRQARQHIAANGTNAENTEAHVR